MTAHHTLRSSPLPGALILIGLLYLRHVVAPVMLTTLIALVLSPIMWILSALGFSRASRASS
jgi:hypothetical protein